MNNNKTDESMKLIAAWHIMWKHMDEKVGKTEMEKTAALLECDKNQQPSKWKENCVRYENTEKIWNMWSVKNDKNVWIYAECKTSQLYGKKRKEYVNLKLKHDEEKAAFDTGKRWRMKQRKEGGERRSERRKKRKRRRKRSKEVWREGGEMEDGGIRRMLAGNPGGGGR